MRRVLVLLALAACGDDTRRPPPPVPVSGSRLKLEWFFYGDGSREPNPDAYYDTGIHARCTPRTWIDGEVRCTPDADQAFYTDAACTALVGRADVIAKPALFLGYDQVRNEQRPSRLYYAGAMTTPPAALYDRIDGACVGPRSAPPDATYFELSGETQASGMVALHDRDVTADDRLDMALRETDDGLYLPLGLRDRAFDLPCRAADRADEAVCEPTEAALATHFADPDCTVPALGLVFSALPPRIARVDDGVGCATYHEVGTAVSTVYTRSGKSCAVSGPQLRGFALGPDLALAPIERTVGEERTHRLQQISITAGAVRLLDDHLFDTATRLECRRIPFDNAVRCIPADTTPGTTLFTAGCTLPVPVVEVAAQTCRPIEFATMFTDDVGLEIRAIGDVPASTLYSRATGPCLPYAPPPGRVLRTLGPPISMDTFVGGHAAGER